MPITCPGLVGPAGVSTEMLCRALLARTTVESAAARRRKKEEASATRGSARIIRRMNTSGKKGCAAVPGAMAQWHAHVVQVFTEEQWETCARRVRSTPCLEADGPPPLVGGGVEHREACP